jgi:probable F420-dependent oxidoreductase
VRVGVVLIMEGDERHGVPRYADVRAAALAAEALGLDSVWAYDHLLFRPPDAPPVGQWECFAFLGALAEATTRVSLGTVVACTPFRNPALLVKTATALDEVSDGRFTLGVGAGWNEAEFTAFDLPFDHRVGRFAEALAVIAPLLRTGHADVDGRYHRVRDCLDLPRGPRPGGPPLLVGGEGPRVLRLAARHADVVNTGVDPADPGRRLGELREACEAVGRDPDDLAVSVNLPARFPDLGTMPHMGDERSTPELLADRLAALEAAGVDEVIFDVRPLGIAALERVAQAVERFRAGLRVG